MNALDTQVGGSHYKEMAIQPMEYSMANGLDACQHTIVKYVTRFRQKGGIQDLEKARHTIDMLIEFERRALAGKVANDNAPLVRISPQSPPRRNPTPQPAFGQTCCGSDPQGCAGCPKRG